MWLCLWEGKMTKAFLNICICPIHNVYTITIEDENGNGYRLIGDKCCHFQYNKVVSWELNDKLYFLLKQIVGK